ncbi:hypothetical protein [Pedobacter sp. Leaf176]|uniref:hypothetical protein n=1 Tax=Pedobacter sp. Leaf176 TaxID=1736286 RepID=UPI0006F27F1B|nr:hypothetical protein [Pedobacter sp. Leaf176]KQR70904.1 hypothetical protein ASF92_05715 [Pedobacter sp. Leaf176]
MKIITFSLLAVAFALTAKGQDILTGLNDPILGVRIKANFPNGNGLWARGYYIVNQDNSSNFLGLGVMGTINNGISTMDYGWIGQDYHKVFMSFLSNGNVGIGITTPAEKLSVNGKIRAHEVKVEMTNWPDYVFDQDYKILGLQELDAYIKVNKHLPDMPSTKEAEANGIALGEMNKLLLKKVEELTLHLIEKDKALKKSIKKAEQLESNINTVFKRLSIIEKKLTKR